MFIHNQVRHLKFIFCVGLFGAVIAGLVSFFLPWQYGAESEVLIISRSSGADSYAQAKAAERIGANLAQVVEGTDFYSKVISSPLSIFDKEEWQGWSEIRRRASWRRDVRVKAIRGTGILRLKVYSYNKENTLAFSEAVTETLVGHGWEYASGDVAVKVVDQPLVSLWPVRPMFILNIFIGFVAGVLAGAIFRRYKKKSVFGVML